ncbi:MAG: flagellar basal body P-ring formation protein FlgA [Cellvibrionaceae bacterium]
MTKRWFSLFFFTTALLPVMHSHSKATQEHQPLAEIEELASAYLLENHPQADNSNTQLVVKVLPISQRLKLRNCEKPLEIKPLQKIRQSGRTSVQVICNSSTPWKVLVGAQVSITAPVAVAARSLPRGHRIQNSDIRMESQSLGNLRNGYVMDPQDILGKSLKRSVSTGSTLRVGNFLTPKMITKGNDVTIQAQLGKLIVVSTGTALSDGQLGQQIAVKNLQSQKVIKGEVIGPNKIQVIL